jgi:mono/diheme cytochrome c family protein
MALGKKNMNKKMLTLLLVALSPIVLFQNCGKPTELQYSSVFDANSQLSKQEASLIVLQQSCASCHSQSVQSGGVGDITDISYLTYARIVIPGEPELSPLINVITNGQMPIGGMDPLSSAEVQVLKDWIKGLNQTTITGGGLPGQTIAPTYSDLSVKVFNAQCVTCHANRNFRLNSYAEVLRTITPGDANNSLLYRSVTVGANGGRMPQGGGLSSAQINAIRDWINAGAMNN